MKLVILGCLAIAGAGVWYFLAKDKAAQDCEDEENDPVGPIKEHQETRNLQHSNNHLRGVMHAAKELVLFS